VRASEINVQEASILQYSLSTGVLYQNKLHLMNFSFFSGLQNDHKDIMKQIERGIHTIHSFGPDALGTATPNVKKPPKTTEPIATVTKVEVGSPAQEAVSIILYLS